MYVTGTLPLAQLALLVLPLAVNYAKACQEAYANLTAQIDDMTGWVSRRVVGGVYPALR